MKFLMCVYLYEPAENKESTSLIDILPHRGEELTPVPQIEWR